MEDQSVLRYGAGQTQEKAHSSVLISLITLSLARKNREKEETLTKSM